jgi:leader peptidase (prepilin peptidase)/N-methyltransferase
MVVLGIIDLRHMRLPRQIVYWTSALVLAAILAGSADTGACQRLGTCALCALAAWAVFGAVWYFYPKGMGGGDVRLAGLVGLGLGWLGAKDVVLGFILAAFVAAFAGSLLIALGRAGRRTPIPFGTCIAVATCAVAYAGPTIVTWYTGLLH